MTSQEKQVLTVLNANRRNTEKVDLQTAREMYLPEERYDLAKQFSEEIVEAVLGTPSCLERAEMMLLELENQKVSEAQKYVYLLNIAYDISNACGRELDSNHPVWDKCATLYQAIPIELYQMPKEVWQISGRKKQKITVSVDELRKILIRLQNETNLGLAERAYFAYIFELVFISLKEIFEEVKVAIIGE